MKKQVKRGLALKDLDEKGHGMARIAKMTEVDHDGDTYAAGAFAWGGDQWAQILPGHSWDTVPLGKARVFERGDEALAELHLNLKTDSGKQWYEALKFDLESCCEGASKAIQEWSYGFRVIDSESEQRDGARVRVLKRLNVFEVSPVVQGAGVGTGTLALKHAEMKEDRFERVIEDLGAIAAIAGDPEKMSAAGLKQLAEIHEGIGAIIQKAGEEDTMAHRLVAAQLYRNSRKHFPGS